MLVPFQFCLGGAFRALDMGPAFGDAVYEHFSDNSDAGHSSYDSEKDASGSFLNLQTPAGSPVLCRESNTPSLIAGTGLYYHQLGHPHPFMGADTCTGLHPPLKSPGIIFAFEHLSSLPGVPCTLLRRSCVEQVPAKHLPKTSALSWYNRS